MRHVAAPRFQQKLVVDVSQQFVVYSSQKLVADISQQFVVDSSQKKLVVDSSQTIYTRVVGQI